MTSLISINVGKNFSRYPVGRYLADGESNGQRFREEFLLPNLRAGSSLLIELDDALGYGSSFLEEAFGGLVREGYDAHDLIRRIHFETADESLRQEILTYINEAVRR